MPVNTVNVGSQVSGTIEEIMVDYNSQVKKGDVLLKIEPSVLQASVDEAKASLDSAVSQRNYAKNEYNRNKSLYNEGFIARSEMEQSQTQYEQAESSVVRAQSQYDNAKNRFEKQKQSTTRSLERLGKDKVKAWSKDMNKFLDSFGAFSNVQMVCKIDENYDFLGKRSTIRLIDILIIGG